MYPLAFKVCKQYIKELDIDIENGRIVGYTCCTVCSMASPAPSSATPSGPLYLHRPPHRPCSGDHHHNNNNNNSSSSSVVVGGGGGGGGVAMVCRCSCGGVCSGVQEMVPGCGRGTAESAGRRLVPCGSVGRRRARSQAAHTVHTVMVTPVLVPGQQGSRGPGC